MSSQLSLAIIETDNKARNDLAAIIGASAGSVGIVTATADFTEALRCIREHQPHIVILEVREVEQGALQTAAILSHSPQSAVFVSCAQKNPDWILRLIRAGAGEYLTKPIVSSELLDAIDKVSRLQGGGKSSKGAAISLYNPSGGMGTTTIAVNLAVALAARGEKVALLDLNLVSGDVAAFLDLASRYNLAHVTDKSGQIDASFLSTVLVRHSSGVNVLTGPVDLEDAARVRPEQIKEVIALLQSIFAYTIIDAGGPLFGCNAAAFNCCDRVLFNTVLNLPALKNAKRYLTSMQDEGLGRDKVKLVLNRYLPKDDIKTADAEKVLDNSVFWAVPNAYAEVMASINQGVPLVACCPRSPAARAIADLAGRIQGENAVTDTIALQGGRT